MIISKDTKAEIMKYLYLERKSVRLVEEVLSYYECEKCGGCCGFTEIYVTDNEYNSLKRLDREIDKKGTYRELGFYLTNPCAYQKCDKKCSVYIRRPFVCKVYPFSYAYGTFMSLIQCPLGERIAKDFLEFGNEKGVTVGEQEQAKHVDSTIKAVDKLNRGMGVTGGKSIESLIFGYELFFEFSAYVRRKYRWKKKMKH